MKLAWMAEDIASARRATSFLVALLVGSMLVNLVLALFAVRLSGHERIVIVPPNIHKTFWVESDRVSSEYLEQMGYFLMQLTLNVTPQSVDHQAKLLLQYAAPASFGELRTALLAAAERLKRDGASTVFSAQEPGRRRTHAPGRCARPAHHLHQRPPRLGSLEGLRHRTPVRGWPHVPQGLS
jgi:conjugal transfer pilus assembly protein TraE